MNITLTADQEAWRRAEIANGHFRHAQGRISYAINAAKRTALRETLNASVARGGANSADEVRGAMAGRLKSDPRRRVVGSEKARPTRQPATAL